MITTRTLGTGSAAVPSGALGLGLMGMSGSYGPAREPGSVAAIGAGVEAGVDLLDTGDFYGMGHDELLLGRALKDPNVDRDAATISAECGARRRDRLAEALGALEIELTAADLDVIEQAVPKGAATGDRYAAPQMASLDSER